ncbi:hypothetical protein N657DRAFT_663457 [Parathielavia appendiculata]|uniref:Uncharacterized protein n=1 Tax=Parathielavia appendiculata TaxID=2587402 RepID=A0AAN6U1C7_9PEZI|nr:hypothetical protein N657DRAFT_663457 [Parathielavia appendiculata]
MPKLMEVSEVHKQCKERSNGIQASHDEDLLQPRSLLLMLYFRGRYQPCGFSAAGGDAMYLCMVTKAIVPIFLNYYGKLVAWEDHADAFDWMHTREQFLLGEALDILEAQDRMKFLVHCCEKLAVSTSLVVMAEEAPSRPPGRLDFGSIESSLAAPTSAAEDQYDPSCFSDQLMIYKEHRQELMKDTDGKPHPILQPTKMDVFWERIISNVLLGSHVELERLSLHSDFPEEDLVAILLFRYFVYHLSKDWLNDLKTTVVASPPVRIVRLFAQDLNMISITSKPGLKRNALERLLRSEPRAQRVDLWLRAGRIGNFSIMCECLRQLDIYQPWVNGYESSYSKVMLIYFKLSHPADKGFFYPMEKTEETVKTLRQAEASLDAFWDDLGKCLHATAGDLSKSVLRRLLSQQRTFKRTPGWAAPGTAGEGEAGIASCRHAVTALNIDEQLIFHVDWRALKVFRTLFFQAAVTSNPREVSWHNFLHDMTSTGFRAEKLYGLVWHFQPSRLDVGRSIQFHEPHSGGKIPFRVARRIGRRLARAYGWVGRCLL